MSGPYTPGTQVALVYEKGDAFGKGLIKLSREFGTAQQAANWLTPYLMDGYPFDVCSAEYLNAKASERQP